MLADGNRCEITRMAPLLNVPRPGYFRWKATTEWDEPTARPQTRTDIRAQITVYRRDSPSIYGPLWITAGLHATGAVVNVKTVAKAMADRGIAGISPRSFQVLSTIADYETKFSPDLVNRHFDRVLGCATDDHKPDNLVITTLKATWLTRAHQCPGTVFNADRGGKLTSTEMVRQCQQMGLRRSMDHTG